MSDSRINKSPPPLNSSFNIKKKREDDEDNKNGDSSDGTSFRDGTKLSFGKFRIFNKKKRPGEKDEEGAETASEKDVGKTEHIGEVVNTNKSLKKLKLEEEEISRVVDLGYMTLGAGETMDASIIAISNPKTMTPAVLPKRKGKGVGSSRGM